ncbi:transposase [Azohydromonas australica]|uniref:transposase n=1 Tax=Azohydromonas australica TaxID=364039 RepID=UPI001B7FED92|nr:transposase [Azohydromonas australica]
MVFVDESGFYLLPAVVRTYAPVAHTPVLRHRLTRDHLSVIGGVGQDERLYFQVHEHAITEVEVIGFCRHLLRHVPGKLLVLWDGAPIHRSRAIKQFLHEEAGERLHLERFPGYAPELDPQEGIWRHLKHVELRNVCCASLAETRKKLRGACQRLRHKPRVIRARIAHAGLV